VGQISRFRVLLATSFKSPLTEPITMHIPTAVTPKTRTSQRVRRILAASPRSPGDQTSIKSLVITVVVALRPPDRQDIEAASKLATTSPEIPRGR